MKLNSGIPEASDGAHSSSPQVPPLVSVSTSTPTILHPSSAFHQALQAFSEIIRAVEALGGTKEDVVCVRMFVTRDEDSGEVGRALKEVFGDVGPAATMILGVRFVSEKMKVEIEADAVVL